MAGIYGIKPRFQQSLRQVEAFLIRRRVGPDALTLGAVPLCALGGAALVAGRWSPWLLLAIPPIAIGRTALNALDGMVARDTGVARPWGSVLNEFCDRLSDVALFTGVAFARGSDTRLGGAVLVAMLLSSFAGNAARAAGGTRQYGGVMGKADRMIYLSVAAVLAFALPRVPVFRYFLVLVLAGLGLTIVQRLRAAYAELQPNV
jgi:CDP-diacylglycerol---glycerol-3-phosphate 3-phosphatidyltransferase